MVAVRARACFVSNIVSILIAFMFHITVAVTNFVAFGGLIVAAIVMLTYTMENIIDISHRSSSSSW